MANARSRKKRSPTSKEYPFLNDGAQDLSGFAVEDQLEKEKPNGGHPLTNAVIMDEIFSFLVQTDPSTSVFVDIATVKCIRLVCKDWSTRVTELIRRKHAPMKLGILGHLGWERTYESYEKYYLQGYFKFMKSKFCVNPLVTKYYIGLNFFSGKKRLFQDFIKGCVPHATELSFYLRSFHDIKLEWSKVEGVANLSRLKELNMHCYVGDNKQTARDIAEVINLLKKLVEKSANLEHLQIKITASANQECDPNLIEMMSKDVCPHLPSSLKKLEMYIPADYKIFKCILEKQFKLTDFLIGFNANDTSFEYLKKILDQSKQSLKNFSIYVKGKLESLPPLPQLISLQMREIDQIGKISYTKDFPKLTNLDLKYIQSEAALENMLPSEQAFSVRKVIMPRIEQAQFISRLPKGFPNLSILEIECSDVVDTLRMIFLYLGQLEVLHFTTTSDLGKNFNIDSVLSGVPTPVLERFQATPDWKNGSITGLITQPSLLSLQKLRKFVFRVTGSGIYASNFLVHFVFMKLEALRELEFPVHCLGGTHLDVECLEMLQEKVKLDCNTFHDRDAGYPRAAKYQWSTKKIEAAKEYEQTKNCKH